MCPFVAAEDGFETKGEGEQLVLLHDGLLGSGIWDDQLETFAQYYTVTRYDARGYGRSEAPAEKFSDVEDLHSLLGFLGVEDTYLVGSSSGGRVAIDFTLEYPEMVNSLVLVGPSLSGYRSSEDQLERISANFSGAKEGDVARSVEAWLGDPYWAPGLEENPDARRKVRQMLTERLGMWRSIGGVRSSLLLPEPPAIQRLSEIDTPTLIVIGEQDDRDNHSIAALLEAHVGRAMRVNIGGAGHMAMLEKPEELDRIVLDFLSGRCPP